MQHILVFLGPVHAATSRPLFLVSKPCGCKRSFVGSTTNGPSPSRAITRVVHSSVQYHFHPIASECSKEWRHICRKVLEISQHEIPINFEYPSSSLWNECSFFNPFVLNERELDGSAKLGPRLCVKAAAQQKLRRDAFELPVTHVKRSGCTDTICSTDVLENKTTL